MGRNSLKTAVVLAALAILMLVPLVEANYMVGNPYVGTTQKMHESRYFGGFYEGRVMFPLPRDRMVKRYISGNAAGIAWQPSRASSSNAQPANDNVVSPNLRSARRCLGCELGTYSPLGPQTRRGRYYYSVARLSGRTRFIFTGDTGSSRSKLLTYAPRVRTTNRVLHLATRSRLMLSPEDLTKLHEEIDASYNGELRSGSRCLSCLYEPDAPFRGRYYAVTPTVNKVQKVRQLE